MLIRLKHFIIRLIGGITRSIAFLPSLLIFGFLLVALMLLEVEDLPIGKWFQDNFKIVIIKNEDTARSILTTIIGGLFSLVVFSFSMVMLLLNQASSSYSPRLLPGLISNKRHQLILGVFIGTIVFALTTLANVLPETRSYKVPGIAIFFCLLATLLCLSLFIYFLHSISQSIQISNILKRLYKKTEHQLRITPKHSNTCSWEGLNQDWKVIKAQESGYLHSVDKSSLLDVCQKLDCNIEVLPCSGTFILAGQIVAKIDQSLEEEELDRIHACFILEDLELIENDFNVGFKHINEIILKAMSPGINDPGTALTAIDYLTDLYRQRIKIADDEALQDDEGVTRVLLHHRTFADLLYANISEIRAYAKHDPQIVLRLVRLLSVLLETAGVEQQLIQVIQSEIQALQKDVNQAIKNPRDLERIQQQFN
jgi:uncharacterized membrane protein